MSKQLISDECIITQKGNIISCQTLIRLCPKRKGFFNNACFKKVKE